MVENNRILLVEGKDDEKVVEKLCENRGRVKPFPFRIKQHDGDVTLIDAFPTTVKLNQGGTVGIIVDADESLASRWQSLRDRLTEIGYEDIPDEPRPNGTILNPPDAKFPKVGVWIMPDNQSKGILEDFLRFLVPKDCGLLTHADSSVANIPGKPLFRPVDRPKALIHTWLAWQEDPGKPFGTAITAKFLDTNVREVDVLMNWLDRLFEEPKMDDAG